jgi:aminoglycoside 3-N-acetyltransferase
MGDIVSDRLRRIAAGIPLQRTAETIAGDIRSLGVRPGDALIVHSSLSSLGYVEGGADAVIDALMSAVTPAGAIVMPTQTSQLKHPTRRFGPATDPDEIERLIGETPIFDPDRTPSTRMGAIPERFRQNGAVHRSRHPLYSFAAWGAESSTIVGSQPLSMALGMGSPLEWLYQIGGKVLLLGVGYIRCTTFHHAEYAVDATRTETPLVPVPNSDRSANDWQPVEEICFIDDETITCLGDAFEACCTVSIGLVGSATSRLLGVADAVNFGVEWLTAEYERGAVTTNCAG